MDEAGIGQPPGRPGDASPGRGAGVTVRYYAAARAATGVDSERLAGATVSAVLDAAVDRHPALAPVLSVASVLVDGRVCDRAAPVGEGLTLEVLPPFAGG